MGFVFAYATTWLLTWLRRMGAKPPEVLTLTVAAAYLAFYVANGPLHVSGVIAVVVFGLYGSATAKWNMSARVHLFFYGPSDIAVCIVFLSFESLYMVHTKNVLNVLQNFCDPVKYSAVNLRGVPYVLMLGPSLIFQDKSSTVYFLLNFCRINSVHRQLA